MCNGENSGSIRFSIGAGTPPFTYSGFKVENPSVVFTGKISSVNEWVQINNLDEGNYTIKIDDTYSNSKVINEFVSQPTKLTVASQTSAFNEYGVSCFGENDGYLKLMPQGGTQPYIIAHDFYSQNVDSVGSLAAGKYHSIITDANGCLIQSDVEIKSPEKLKAVMLLTNPDCTGPSSGKIALTNVSGGVDPYLISLNNQNIAPGQEVVSLKEGYYELTVTDKNGCVLILNDTLVAAEIPDLNVTKEILQTELGDSIILVVSSNLSEQQITWMPDDKMSCNTCLITTVLPINDTYYTIKVISKDGCEDEATIETRVSKRRSFVMSNIISANGDGLNDKVTYLAGRDVSTIDYIRVYDRWGDLVFLKENIPPSDVAELDWDVEFQGRILQSGVFTWLANVSYIDDVSILYKGSLTILK